MPATPTSPLMGLTRRGVSCARCWGRRAAPATGSGCARRCRCAGSPSCVRRSWPVDVPLWGTRARLYPARRQLREERAVHSAIAGRGRTHGARRRRSIAARRARVSPSSISAPTWASIRCSSPPVAAQAHACSRSNRSREFSIACASTGRPIPRFAIYIVPMAVADREGEIEFIIDTRDSGGSQPARAGAAAARKVCACVAGRLRRCSRMPASPGSMR